MAINWAKLQQNAENADAKTRAAQVADFAKVKKNTTFTNEQRQAEGLAAAKAAISNPSAYNITPTSLTSQLNAGTTSILPSQMQPESGVNRAIDTIGAGSASLVGGLANATKMATTGKYSPVTWVSKGIDKINGTNYTEQNAANQQAFVNQMMDQSKLSTEYAKRGISKAGQTAVDIGSGATELAGNLAVGALTGGSALIPMATQAFGSGAYSAQKAGASEEKQLAYGALEGGTVALTQGLMNAGSSILTKSFGESPISKILMDKTGSAIAKFVQSDAGRVVANKIASTGESALSQSAIGAVQAALEPAYQKITFNPNAKENAEDIIHNAIVSGAIGALVGAAGKTPERVKSAEDNYVEPVKLPASGVEEKPVTNALAEANALTDPQRAPETKADVYQQSINEQESNIKTLEDKAEYERAIYRNLYAEYRSTDVATRRPELIAESATQNAKVEAAENAVTKAQNELQAFKDAHTNEIQSKTNVEKTVGILSDLNGRFINENTLKEIEQIGALPKETAELRKAFDRATRLQKKDNELYVELTNAASLKESVETQAKLDKVNAQLDTAVQTLKSAQDKIANYSKSVETETSAPKAKTSIFPENSLGAKITTPKSNIPLKDSKNTASVQNAQSNELGAMDTQFPYKEAPTQSILKENYLNPQERTDNAIDNVHQVYTDEMARAQAQQRLTLDYDGEKADLLKKQDWDKGDDVTAQYIIKQETEQARKTGDWSEAKKVWKAYQEHGTTAGQALQARQQFKSDPDFVAAEANDTLSSAKAKKLPQKVKQDVINKVYEQTQTLDNLETGNKDGLISLIEKNNEIRHTTGIFRTTTSKHTDNMLRDYLNAYGEQGEANLREVALSQIRSIASDYEKTPMIEKVSSLYINGLLSKVSTVMRNVVGNTGFDIIDSGSNNVAVPLDALVSRLTGTRSISVDKSWLSAAKRKGSNEAFARSCIETALDVNTDGAQSKFEQSSNRTFKMTGNFAERLFSTYERNIAYLLTTPDEFAKGGVSAEASRGLNALAEKGKITDTDYLQSRPQELAKQRTFQDDSNIAKGLIGIRNAANDVAGVTTKTGDKVGLGTITVPFAKVPANLVNEAINYSPAGIVKGGTWLAKTLINAKSGNLDINAQANAVTDIGRGLTGTAMIALATALAAKGIVKVSNDKDWNKAALEKAENKTGTQLDASAMWRWLHHGGSTEWKSGDSLVNVGFADPFNTFLATGALISDSYKADGKLTAGNLANSSASAIIQSVMDLPAISTLSSLQSGYNYSKSDTEAGKVGDAALAYAQSAGTGIIPNFVKGIAAGTDPYSRDTSADTKKQQFINHLMSGIPGAREKLPIASDALGNKKASGSTPTMQFLNNNILPGTVTNYKPNAVTDELSRVADSTGAKSLFPSAKVDSQIKNNNQTYALDNAQKQDFLKSSGSMLQNYLERLIGSHVYENATDSEKADLINKMSNYSTDKSKAEVVTGQGGKFTKSGYDTVAKAEQEGITPTAYYAYQQFLKGIDKDGGNSTQAQETQAINKTTDLSTQMKGKLWQLQNKDTKPEKNPYTGALAQMGVQPETIVSFMQRKSELDAEPNEDFGQTTVSKANKGRAYQLWQYAKTLDISPAQRSALYDMYQEWGFIPSLSLKTIGKKGY